ncbi:MAG: NACHT domain-containing protein [Deltaproteobacteria bacterium]|nr:NACHT domain-containing protein [Deltaproteobacteria bacterium]
MLSTGAAIEWLHISDLHIQDDWRQDRVLNQFQRDLPKLLQEAQIKPQLVFATGDLAWSGRPEQYESLQVMLEEVMDGLGLDRRDDLFVVPGNHDVGRKLIGPGVKAGQNWILGLGGENRSEFQELTGDLIATATELAQYGRRLGAYSDFTEKLLGPARGVSPDRPWRTDVRTIGGIEVGIASLCSAWMCGPDEDKSGRIVLGERQVVDALRELDQARASFKIVLLHHPLRWLHEAEQRAISELLATASDVVLHGHLHEADLSAVLVPSGVHVVSGAGALYSGSKWKHGFQAASFDPGTGELSTSCFTWSERDGGFWHADPGVGRSAPNGQRVIRLRPLAEKPTLLKGPTDELLSLVTRLRQATARVHGRFDFVGLPDTARKPRTTLSDLFVPVHLENYRRGASEEGITLAALQHSVLERGKNSRYGPRFTVELNLDIDEVPRASSDDWVKIRDGAFSCVVLGNPGSGKTTLLLHLAMLAAQNDGYPVPILIRLREYVRQNRRDGLLEFAAGECRALLQVPVECVDLESLAKQGRLLILVDGMDEVAVEEDRRRVRDMIGELAAAFPNCPIIATSRIVGYDRAPLDRDSFEEFQLAPFDDAQLQLFFENWYLVAEPDDPRNRGRRVADISLALDSEPRAKELARNPLLATLIALVHRYETNLPGDRARLYDLCVKTLLETWPRARGRRFDPLDEGRQRVVLEHLALRIQESRESRAHEADEVAIALSRPALTRALVEVFAERGFGGASDAERRALAESWIRWLEADTGLLVEQQPGVFGFLHLSLLEFLAARALLERELAHGEEAAAAIIIDRHRSPVWQETLLLLLGSEATRKGLVDRATKGILDDARYGVPIDNEGESAQIRRFEIWTSWTFLLSLLREEVDVTPEVRAETLDGASISAFRFGPWLGRSIWKEAETRLHDILLLGKRHGLALAELVADRIERNGVEALAGLLAILPASCPFEEPTERRTDRRGTVVALLDFPQTHRAFRWGAVRADRANFLAWAVQCPFDLAAFRILRCLADEPSSASAAFVVPLIKGNAWRFELTRTAALACRHRIPLVVRFGSLHGDISIGLATGIAPHHRDGAKSSARAGRRFVHSYEYNRPLSLAESFLPWVDGYVGKRGEYQFAQGLERYFRHDVIRDHVDWSDRVTTHLARNDTRKNDQGLEQLFESIREVASVIFHGVALEATIESLSVGRADGASPFGELKTSPNSFDGYSRVGRSALEVSAEYVAASLLPAEFVASDATLEIISQTRVQDFWTWLFFEPLAKSQLRRNSEPVQLGLLLALGLFQTQTTWTWPWGDTWKRLLSDAPNPHWFPAFFWHVCHSIDDPNNPTHVANAEACLDRSDWPELAEILRAYRPIRTPSEVLDLFDSGEQNKPARS